MSESRSTERTAVRTYVPAYQRDEWDAHADDLDMSRSEFVRTMVQAGRRTFDADDPDQAAPIEGTSDHDRPSTEGPPGSSGNEPSDGNAPPDTGVGPASLEDRVLDVLEDDCLSWNELFDTLTEDIEFRLESTLADLQEANRVQYRGPEGGYVLVQ